MPKKVLLSVIMTSCLALTGTAYAQNTYSSGNSMSATSFEGAYAGIQGGYDNYDLGINNAKDVEGGVFAGYNALVMPKVIVGGEANFNLTAADSSSAGVDVDESYGLSGRVGFLASDQVMFYGRGGWVRTNYDFVVGSKTLDGWTAGGGVEFAASPQMTVRGEFVYANYEKYGAFEPKQTQFNIGIAYHY